MRAPPSSYDADGRVVRRVLPTGEVAWTDYDAVRAGRRPRSSPGAASLATATTRRPGRGVLRHLVRPAAVPPRRRRAAGRGRQRQRRRDPLRLRRERPRRRDHRPARQRHPARVRRHEPLHRRDRPAGPHHPRRLRRRPAVAWQDDPTGRRTTWTYDASGPRWPGPRSTAGPSPIERDLRARRLVCTDHTRPDGRAVQHTTVVEPPRPAGEPPPRRAEVSWAYDADGRRTVDDHARRQHHPLRARRRWPPGRGRAPAAGPRDAGARRVRRLVAASAGGMLQAWEHRDGFVVAHTVGDADGPSRTTITRDDSGRIIALDRDGVHDRLRLRRGLPAGGGPDRRLGRRVALRRRRPPGRRVDRRRRQRGTPTTPPASSSPSPTPAGPRVTTTTSWAAGSAPSTRRTGPRAGWSATGWLAGVTDRVGDRVHRHPAPRRRRGELADRVGDDRESCLGHGRSLRPRPGPGRRHPRRRRGTRDRHRRPLGHAGLAHLAARPHRPLVPPADRHRVGDALGRAGRSAPRAS